MTKREALAMAVADRLAQPDSVPGSVTRQPWWRQSLAHGAPGIALLHIEMAAMELGPWRRAHDWLSVVASAPLISGRDSHLFYGAPALAHALACAAEQQKGSYKRALDALDRAIITDTHRRVAEAYARINTGNLPTLAEFDVIRGLTGLGSYLLSRDPDGGAIRAVLTYLVRLSEPLRDDGDELPGWWVATSPNGRTSERFA